MKRLSAEIKRLKKSKDLDKDEIEYDSDGNDASVEIIPCTHCSTGFMTKINIVDRQFYKCGSCERTKKA